jgi:hypothetical protein
VRLGTQQHPVGRYSLPRVGERGERHIDRAARPLQREPADVPAHAGDDIVPAGGREASGGDAADAAEADHGDGETALNLLRRGHVA